MLQSYYALTIPGVETLAFSEIRTHAPDAELIKFSRGMVQFRSTMTPDALLRLRTVEDVFVTVAHITGIGHGGNALRVFHSAALKADVNAALGAWRRARKAGPAKTWRVVSQMQGTHNFRRVDAGQAVSDALKQILPRGMRYVEDDADLEFWLWISGGGEALVGVRLSDATMRHRTYKHEHLPASLRPTVAAAMGLLARPTESDVVLDPLCGAGTIVIERALLAPYKQAMGSDISEAAVKMAERNSRSARIHAKWQTWDARSLPLEDESVTRIISNLPFGKQIGSHEQNISLYKDLVQQFGRVLTKDGLMVTLTSEDRLWETNLRTTGWRITKKVVISVLGQPASIFVAERAK
ncbi:MAG TPA: RNA methyltransferase [Ktedonobacter sp.]|nr:RNA methyltransferase [Ktedonobacter sp.]